MDSIGHAVSQITRGTIEAQETRREGKPCKRARTITFSLPDQHYVDAIKEEAKVRGMSVNHFMRSMVRGYFGAA